MHPQELELPRLIVKEARSGIDDVCVKDADDASITKRVGGGPEQHHDVTMLCIWIDYILRMSNIIGSVIDSH